jgi:GxxExxY protein
MAAVPQEITPRINHITHQIIAAAMKVHNVLGPGLLESAYHASLLHELRKQGLTVASQVGLPVVYEGEKIDLGYRIDLIVGDVVIVEIKCLDAINPVHQAQLLSYMRLSGRQVGLLINFHVAHLGDGIKRMVDGYDWSSKPLTTEEHRSKTDLCVTLCPLWFKLLSGVLTHAFPSQNFTKFLLHLRKFAVISTLRTNFSGISGI